MEMTAVTNKAVLCSISRTRGELEAGRGEWREAERKEAEGGRKRGERELISANSDPKM